MKKFKIFFAILLVLALITGVGASALAVEPAQVLNQIAEESVSTDSAIKTGVADTIRNTMGVVAVLSFCGLIVTEVTRRKSETDD